MLCSPFSSLWAPRVRIFSPSKYGSIPEIVRTEHISSANGLVGMTTFVAIILGTAAGNALYSVTTVTESGLGPAMSNWWIWSCALIGVATVGWIASLFIGQLTPACPSRAFPKNPAGQVVSDLRELISRRPLLWAALGSAFFWAIGVMAQCNIDKLAVPDLVGSHPEGQFWVGPLMAALTFGIGIGCVLAGLWSAHRVELGIVPLWRGGDRRDGNRALDAAAGRTNVSQFSVRVGLRLSSWPGG